VIASASICSRSGNRMNKSPNTAAAPIYTALFHIGRRPSRTPEKMNPGKVLRKRSTGTTTSCFSSVATEAEVISLLGSEMFSGRVASSETISGAISGDGFGCATTASGKGGVLANFGSVAAEAEVMSLLGSKTFSDRVASSKPVSAVISGDGFGCAATGSGEGGVLANFGGRIR